MSLIGNNQQQKKKKKKKKGVEYKTLLFAAAG